VYYPCIESDHNILRSETRAQSFHIGSNPEIISC
jgi:hypothetical protein